MKNGFENPNQVSLGTTLWGVKDFPQGEGDLVAPTKFPKEHMFWAQVLKAICTIRKVWCSSLGYFTMQP